MAKYTTLAALKSYAKATQTAEDDVLQTALDWAEGEFERLAGSQFDRQAVSSEIPARAWFDRRGMAWLVAQERGPVASVASISYRSIEPGSSWTALSWTADDLFAPPQVSPPHPSAWTVRLLPSNSSLAAVSADSVLFRWSYTGGYAAIPDSLVLLIHRLAWWKYALRQAPLGQITTPPFGVTEVLPALPADMRMDIGLWTRKAMG